MNDYSFDLNFSDSDSTKKLFNASSQSATKSKKKEKNTKNSYSSQNSSNFSQTPETPAFSHVFICIHRYEKLFKCQMQTLFARIRFHPKISIIQTINAMCISNSIELNCSYALDLSSIPPFRNEDFTPVVELFRRIPKHSELVGVSLLPLKENEKVKIQKKYLTYFYHNSRAPVKDIMTDSIVGNLVVSIAFGFPEHKSLFDPNHFYSQDTQNIKINPTNNQIENEDENSDVNENNESEKSKSKNETRRHHGHHHRHHHKKKSNNWQKMATAAGWKPSTFVGSDWKEKAVKRGWIPPEKQLKSSIAINCQKDDIVQKESISTQYDPVLLTEFENKNASNSSLSSSTNGNDSNDELEDIINILNPKSKKNKRKNNLESDSSQLTLTSPSTIFQREFPKLCMTPVIQLLSVDEEPDRLLSESSDESDILLNDNVNDIINNVLNCKSESKKFIPQLIKNSNGIEEKRKVDSNVYDIGSDDLLNEQAKNVKGSSFSSGSSSASDLKKCFGNMDKDMKKILDIYGIDNDDFL